MTNLEMIKALTGCSDDALLAVLMQEATDRILGMTGRTTLIHQLEPAMRALTVCYYNRMGSEGMVSRSDSEIGISSTFVDIPADVQQQINRYRLARVGGAYYETTTSGS